MDTWVVLDVSDVTWAEPERFMLNLLPHPRVRINGVVAVARIPKSSTGVWELPLPSYDHTFHVHDARLVKYHEFTGGMLQLKKPPLIVKEWEGNVARVEAPQDGVDNATHVRLRIDVGFIQ